MYNKTPFANGFCKRCKKNDFMYSNSSIKDKILSQTTQEDIYLHYLGIPSFPKNMRVSNPFTDKDKNPSFHFYYDGDVLKYKGHNESSRNGDVWQFVADLNQLDCKTDFVKVCSTIAIDINIDLEINQNSVKPPYPAKKEVLQTSNQSIAKDKTSSKTLTVTKREFTALDLEYWEKLGIAKAVLEKYNVSSISSYCWSGKKPIYTKNGSVAFVIELDGQIKLYIPFQPDIGVKKNVLPAFKSGIFGFEQLGTEKKEIIIICAGEKDTIIANSRGFNAVTFGSESGNPKPEQIELLQKRCTHLFVCYDNDEAGEKGRNALVKRFPEIIALQLPANENIKGYDVTDYFQEYTAADFQKIIDLAVKNKNAGKEVTENTDLTIFHKAENYISKHYDLRFDVIANEIEISPKDKNDWKELNEDSLYVEMQKKHLKISKGNLSSILLSDFVPKFNPIKIYFENLPEWDKKTDFIKQFLDYVELEQGEDRSQFIYQFTKWCVRSVKCSTTDGYYNKQAFVLSDDAKGQNIGKTTLIRFLVPTSFNKYYCENLPEDKDALKRLGQNFIINLDELATLSKTDINKLKSLFSSDKIKTRLPYGKKDIVISRVANFIGSTNMSSFLVDETGSVRWLCFIVKKINFNYSLEFNIDNLWAQAYSLSKDETFKAEMTPEDIRLNELRNDKFQILSPERELIPKYFEVPTNIENAEFLTATWILNYINVYTSNMRLNKEAIGRAMQKCGFIRKKHNGVWGYWVVKKEYPNG
ncbi:hypothetical protein IVB69_09970 [Flavobacterium sp. J49]|uniref:VapE domain-containing protein n=1 Tax=Flavobacterium sp. J49 TaxID=2718534 RepID=UPI0015939807|nr:VapE domain-containing protein [Flavobacterium sp. J49]MBF6641804.1 hypothetical protein [Flavobacterium sp. J49]NIC03051.1 hypothetical protein [Flavobacterium sp. J49]